VHNRGRKGAIGSEASTLKERNSRNVFSGQNRNKDPKGQTLSKKGSEELMIFTGGEAQGKRRAPLEGAKALQETSKDREGLK